MLLLIFRTTNTHESIVKWVIDIVLTTLKLFNRSFAPLALKHKLIYIEYLLNLLTLWTGAFLFTSFPVAPLFTRLCLRQLWHCHTHIRHFNNCYRKDWTREQSNKPSETCWKRSLVLIWIHVYSFGNVIKKVSCDFYALIILIRFVVPTRFIISMYSF